jgi:hypothetical protein
MRLEPEGWAVTAAAAAAASDVTVLNAGALQQLVLAACKVSSNAELQAGRVGVSSRVRILCDAFKASCLKTYIPPTMCHVGRATAATEQPLFRDHSPNLRPAVCHAGGCS